jgi:hypothetical protein
MEYINANMIIIYISGSAFSLILAPSIIPIVSNADKLLVAANDMIWRRDRKEQRTMMRRCDNNKKDDDDTKM